jgi:glutamate racemase
MQIGLFDSGIGGITIAKKVIRYLPQYNYTYFADDKHMPYGEKDADLVYRFTIDALRVLFEHNCAIAILACNTATTVLPRIQHEWLPVHFPNRKVLGVIRPTAEHIAHTSKDNSEIYLMATPRTVFSKAYDHELSKIQTKSIIHEIPCGGLAAAIEHSNAIFTDRRVLSLCEKYIKYVPNDHHVIMYTACTHYAFVKRILRKLRPLASVINQPTIVTKSLTSYLENHPSIERRLNKSSVGSIEYACSTNDSVYLRKLERLLRT